MRKLLLFMSFFVFSLVTWAQEKTVSGKVTSAKDGTGMPGVNVIVKGTSNGTVTDVEGNYSLSAPEDATLVFSFVGLASKEEAIAGRSVIDVQMQEDVQQLGEVVVTALGIEREERSLGYSVQEVSGDAVSKAKEGSFISSLSGKVSGLNIKKSNSLGGSVNAVVRGSNSLTGNNQVLFVVDGIPISNSNLNTADQQTGGGGYDYGNAASDIDPESIASISVLKGATAAALYGSDAANGVVLITTKKGSKQKGIGVTLNHNTSFSVFDKKTFPKYQNSYGAGYSPGYGDTSDYFYDRDVNGDGQLDLLVPVGEDASFGAAYDPNLLVYTWESLYPELDTYMQPQPWVGAENGPDYIFETGVSNVTSLSFQGGNEKGSFRAGYTHDNRTGILPNSEITRDVIDFNASYNLSEKLSVDGKMSYFRTEGKGRYGTGYDGGNVVQGLRQWFQTNVDLKAQEQAYNQTGQNITWNPNSNTDVSPHYFNNPYFVLNENYETDRRNRFFGKFQVNYEITEWMKAMARFGVDSYSDLQEERMAVGSLAQPSYSKYHRTFEAYNSDFILQFNKNITDKFSFNGLLGVSIKNTRINSTRSSTNGGLVVDGVYALSNSVSALNPPTETDTHVRKFGYYGQATFGYNDLLYLDATLRVDKSSTLPEDNNTYLYPSVAGSFIFSELMDQSWLNMGKVRLGWAQVTSDAQPYSLLNTYQAATPYGSTPLYFIDDTANNPDLEPETTEELELGLEMSALDNRVRLDLSLYKKNTTNQILPVQVSKATGFNYRFVNAGEMENKGIEVSLFGAPVRTSDFEWGVNVNWSRNRNKVVSLFEGGENLLIYSAWSTAINARKGEAYGAITGSDYVYLNGKRVVGSDGKYLMSESTTEIIGNIQPDWNAGVNNTFSYKNLSFSFLIDIQHGGDIVNYDMGFGRATGLYEETAGLNELGNPVRDPVSEGGGVLLDGVTADGAVNTVRADASTYETPFGYYGGSVETGGYAPDASLVYDASYIKLREVTLNYRLPSSVISKTFLQDVTVGVYGRNLWIIDKNLPYGDPEFSASSGNSQGIQNGALPATKEYGFNVRVQF
ncbi:SusC/RagA family TonB-linked outer membrane protein [Fulvivirga maritima]|uniref:SusC/RagA family TonB-linked outer membrane protein n=1 Tax=Fulvivirga maritima TaxID=2904247 RepID=UPI001F27AD29|nr:SusC/RagA family TonB-linked outer membrane protein [Fulvivirga maritima]UII27988.1 SusC/RagA family TonB-linked outer membrane protein [Fulvivirga maritima]